MGRDLLLDRRARAGGAARRTPRDRPSRGRARRAAHAVSCRAAAPAHAARVEPAPPPPPPDTDQDGVPDREDACPKQPGVHTDDPKTNGCPLPVDSDHDGVADSMDRCPNTPPTVPVDASGCPLDSDHDQVPDYLDRCPDTPAGSTVLDITQIQRILPHRFPFLLIDRVISLTPRQKIVALKNVSANEPHFAGHFPGFPIMPGVLIVEAIAQAGGALLLTEVPERDGKLMVFTGIERARFSVDGEALEIPVKLKVHDSVFVPLAKWPMLIAGNYRCIRPDQMIPIKEAVHGDVAVSREIYDWVATLCHRLGAEAGDLVPFEKYAKAAEGLGKPSSAARALFGGAQHIERVDSLVRRIAHQLELHSETLHEIVTLVDERLGRNRTSGAGQAAA